MDFSQGLDAADTRLARIQDAWCESVGAGKLRRDIQVTAEGTDAEVAAEKHVIPEAKSSLGMRLRVPVTLLRRSWVKSYRDVMVYGIRVLMYLGNPSPPYRQPLCLPFLLPIAVVAVSS